MSEFTALSCQEFTSLLSTKAPVPGGGGASALAGAIGMALGSMVGSLTVGKKKYAAVQEDIKAAMVQAQALRQRLLSLVEEDAKAFAPLAQAYRLPASTEAEKAHKVQVMERCLQDACAVPLALMECCCQAIQLQQIFAEKGSVMAVSDAGVGAALCKAALQGAYLNVKINTRAMKDRDHAFALEARAERLLSGALPLADQIYNCVVEKLR